MRKATKYIITFAVILIAGLNFIVPAFAQDPFADVAVGGLTGASGAGLFGSMASMSGVNIEWSQSGTDSMDAMWNVLNPEHVYFTGEKHEANPDIDPDDIYDYIQVDIEDWLEAQSNFIANFVYENNVTDNDSGTITTSRNFHGIPLDVTVGTNIRSVYLDTVAVNGAGTYNFESGPYRVIAVSSGSRWNINFYYNGVNVGSSNNRDHQNTSYSMYLSSIDYQNVRIGLMVTGNTYGHATSNVIGSLGNASTIPWTSETVNTSVFDGWESAKVKIPKSVSQLQHGWTPVDFFNELDRIWSGAGEDNIIIEDGAQPVPPIPPVPVPSTPLGEVPFDDWVDLWGQGIYEQLENQSDTLDFIGSNGTDAIEELESIDENIGALEETAESIDTNIGVGNGILGGIRSLAQSAVDYLERIAEHVGELVEEIVEGTETLIAGILNQIPQAFGVIFGPIKQASSIWHYVVDWLQSIGAPFQFIWSMASGTSYYIILPIYASLAAAVVLAFYKRFGK